jgi:hypothetical protein
MEDETNKEDAVKTEDTSAEDNDYQFEDADMTHVSDADKSKGNDVVQSNSFDNGARAGNSSGRYADELFSKRIDAKFRTFFIDLKESSNGKFVKVSEKSRGRKSTIMMDAEDIPEMIAALQEVSGKL